MTYIAGYETPLPVAVGIVLDLILETVKTANIPSGGKIQQLREKNLAIVYDTSQPGVMDIDTRIKKLKTIKLRIA